MKALAIALLLSAGTAFAETGQETPLGVVGHRIPTPPTTRPPQLANFRSAPPPVKVRAPQQAPVLKPSSVPAPPVHTPITSAGYIVFLGSGLLLLRNPRKIR